MPVAHVVEIAALGACTALSAFGMANDLAYYQTHQVEWLNAAAWANVASLLPGLPALLLGIAALLRARQRRTVDWLHPGLLLAAALVLGLNALHHARDAWATMPVALILSVTGTLLMLGSLWTAHARGAPGLAAAARLVSLDGAMTARAGARS